MIGGGPAGAATALLLARAGRAVTLIERDAAPRHKICGEFLSGEAQLYLGRLGIDLAAAVPITHVRLARGRYAVRTALPFPGRSLTRRHLDAALLDAAARAGATLRIACEARAFAPGFTVTTAAGAIDDPTVVLATGKHELRGARREPARAPEDLIGFKTYFALTPRAQAALAGHVEVTLFRNGYAGLQPVEGGLANLCLLAGRDRFDAAGDFPRLLDALLAECPHLADRLAGAVPRLPRPLSIYRVPYGFLHRAADRPGLFRVGDQMAVIPSFTGDGIAIALHTAFVTARAIAAGDTSAACHARLRRECGRPVRNAMRLYRLARLPLGQPALLAACAVPGVLRHLAAITRLPSSCLPA